MTSHYLCWNVLAFVHENSLPLLLQQYYVLTFIHEKTLPLLTIWEVLSLPRCPSVHEKSLPLLKCPTFCPWEFPTSAINRLSFFLSATCPHFFYYKFLHLSRCPSFSPWELSILLKCLFVCDNSLASRACSSFRPCEDLTSAKDVLRFVHDNSPLLLLQQ